MTTVLETRGVLAGAYRGQNTARGMLTHTIVETLPSGKERVLCTRVRVEHLTDHYAHTPAELDAPPTCTECLRRDPRFPDAPPKATADGTYVRKNLRRI